MRARYHQQPDPLGILPRESKPARNVSASVVRIDRVIKSVTGGVVMVVRKMESKR
jgi:hypothetical protein